MSQDDGLDPAQPQSQLDEELLEIIENIEKDPEFEEGLLTFLEDINKDDFDLSALQTKMFLLIKPIVEKAYLGKDKDKKLEEIRKERETLKSRVRDLSFYFTMKEASKNNQIPINIDMPSDKQAFLNKESVNSLKNEIKRQAIYEVYKMVNPRRIAGETKKDNFVGNYITKGEEAARKFDGGSEEDIKKYPKGTLKKLQKARKRVLSKGGLD